jgi:DNA repair exonuclease SbcCD ATPase subunit
MGNGPSALLLDRLEQNGKNFSNFNPTQSRIQHIEPELDQLKNKKRKLHDEHDDLEKKRVKIEDLLSMVKEDIKDKVNQINDVDGKQTQLYKELDTLQKKNKEYGLRVDCVPNLCLEVFDNKTNDELIELVESDDGILIQTVTFEEKDGKKYYSGELSYLFDDSEDKYFVLIIWDMIDVLAETFDRVSSVRTTPIDEKNKVGKHEIYWTKDKMDKKN